VHRNLRSALQATARHGLLVPEISKAGNMPQYVADVPYGVISTDMK
jgi:hypothetical protein